MQCSMCSQTIEEALKKVDGVQSVEVNLDAKTAKVTFDAEATSVPAAGAGRCQDGLCGE